MFFFIKKLKNGFAEVRLTMDPFLSSSTIFGWVPFDRFTAILIYLINILRLIRLMKFQILISIEIKDAHCKFMTITRFTDKGN